MKLCAFLLSCVVVSLSSVWATDYCNPQLCKDLGRHVACQHSNQFCPRCPPDAEMLSFSKQLQDLVVSEINEKRNFIAGGGDQKHSPACRMATMSWDNELAQLAELNAKQCYVNHDQCRNTDAFKFAGQNLAWIQYKPPLNFEKELRAAIKVWYDERVHSDMRNIRKCPHHGYDRLYADFTVLMGDRNIRVGCGASTFTKRSAPFKSIVLACNFATGNMLDRATYKDCPRPAMECTSGTNPQFSNLCSNAEAIDPN